MRYSFHREALAEFLAATRRYAARSPAAAARFVDAVEDAVRAIAERPEAWPLRRGGGRRRDVRAFVIDRFPFSVVYRIRPSEIRVLAIAHAKRRPDYWTRRR